MNVTDRIAAPMHLNIWGRQSLKIVCIGNYFMTNVLRDKKKKFKMLKRKIINSIQRANINFKETLNFYFSLLTVFYIPSRCQALCEAIVI